MRFVRIHSFITALTVVVASAACDNDVNSPVALDPLPPLAAETWHVHTADGQALPALVAHGIVQGALEQTFLDSAQLRTTADGRWELRTWLQLFRAGELVNHVPRLDAGAWTVTDAGYQFTSDVRGPQFVLSQVPGTSITVSLQVEALPGVIVAALLRTPPPPTPTGAWLADAVHGRPIPDAIYVFDPFEENGRTISVHLVVDSIRLALHPTGKYRHRIWYTEWEGNPGGSWHTLRSRFALIDFGVWARTGDALELDSEWLQNHRMTGTFTATTQSLAMQHGLTHGDPPVAFRYRR